jgi:hypothetical protein
MFWVWRNPDISEEYFASIFRVEERSKQETNILRRISPHYTA